MNIATMDLNLLVVFQALMTERSVTRAAAKVGLSQPALSNALARLRTHLGDKLFVRSRKAMVPTPRALELAPEIEAAFNHLHAALQPSGFSPQSSNATFRLATTDEVEMSVFPTLMKRLEVSAPGVSINCARLQGFYHVPDAELQSGSLDFAVGSFAQPLPVEAGLSFTELYEHKLVCIARIGHPAVKGQLSLSKFCKFKHVAAFYPGVGPGLLDRLLAGRGYKRNVALSLPHWLSVPFAVAHSDLIATVPEIVARTMGPSLRLQQFKCPVAMQRLSISLVWHVRTNDSPAHRWLRQLIVDACRKAA